MKLRSFCIGCRHEKDNKSDEPCATICEARVHYYMLIENPEYVLPNEFLRGNDRITIEQLTESLKHPIKFKRRLNKTEEQWPKGKRQKFGPNTLMQKTTKFSRKLNREENLEPGYKFCPDCPMDENPRPLEEFFKYASGFRGASARCKKHHRIRYHKKTKGD